MHPSRSRLLARPGFRARLLLSLLTLALVSPLWPSEGRALAGPSGAGGLLGAPAAQSGPARDPRFGLNETASSGIPEVADRAGAGWSRITFWWSQLQKHGPEEFDLFATEHDVHIDDDVRRGRELVGIVVNAPAWATVDGTPNGVPRGLQLAWDHPDNHWGRFMHRAAKHYRGRIDTWILWNEVDIKRGPWQTWNGSVEEYAQMLKVGYRAVKAANPQARVLPFGAAWWYDRGDYLRALLDVLANDPEARANNFFFDVANLHLYSRADDIPRIIAWYRGELAARGMSKPIWIGETNAIPYDDPIWPASKANFRATMDEQASYLVQAFATYLGLGVERVSVNRAQDGSDFTAGGEPFGLLRNDGSTRPAFAAYQVVTRYFADTRDAQYIPDNGSGVTRVVLVKDGERVTVAWTMSPQGARAALDATAARALRVTKYGETSPLEAEDGQYRIDLAPATANSNEHDPRDYVVGGDPVILVERTDGDLSAAHRPLEVAPRAR